jgi:hypothetical protein
MKINKAGSEHSDASHYLNEIAQLKNAFIEIDYESVRQRIQFEDKILEFKAEIKKLKAARRSGSQSKKKVLEQVGQPDSNTIQGKSTSINCDAR